MKQTRWFLLFPTSEGWAGWRFRTVHARLSNLYLTPVHVTQLDLEVATTSRSRRIYSMVAIVFDQGCVRPRLFKITSTKQTR